MATGGYISAVQQDSPAYDAGFEPGCIVLTVNGNTLHDIIDWRWYSATDEIHLSYIDNDGDRGEIDLIREEGEDWGFEFRDALFDGTKQCRNSCIFCFIQQLPSDSRNSLRIRDDDFRLSFLLGNFVTFTNLSPEDEARIIEQHISPLRYSLHAHTPALRERMIGKHAAEGFDAFTRLLSAGIQFHVQIVLMPHVNDGEELVRTLEWSYDQSGILSVGIVPLGYTKHQASFVESFTTPEAAQAVIELIGPFQQQALKERGHAWVNVSDEFYTNAYPSSLLKELPPASYYGDFDMFDDGVGMVRSFVDDFNSCVREQNLTSKVLQTTGVKTLLVCGCAQKAFFDPLLQGSSCAEYIVPLYVDNNYFGGNVNVTGLLCAQDIVRAVTQALKGFNGAVFAAIPAVVFNSEGVTLDGYTLEDIAAQVKCPVHVVSCQASEFLVQIADIAQGLKEDAHG